MARLLPHYIDTSREERARDILEIAARMLPALAQMNGNPQQTVITAIEYAVELYDAVCDLARKE